MGAIVQLVPCAPPCATPRLLAAWGWEDVSPLLSAPMRLSPASASTGSVPLPFATIDRLRPFASQASHRSVDERGLGQTCSHVEFGHARR